MIWGIKTRNKRVHLSHPWNGALELWGLRDHKVDSYIIYIFSFLTFYCGLDIPPLEAKVCPHLQKSRDVWEHVDSYIYKQESTF